MDSLNRVAGIASILGLSISAASPWRSIHAAAQARQAVLTRILGDKFQLVCVHAELCRFFTLGWYVYGQR
jgi:hypothetical protein